jgi:xylulokinase
VSASPETAAVGAAYLARMSVGAEEGFDAASAWARTGRIVEPRADWVDACAERYRRFREVTG